MSEAFILANNNREIAESAGLILDDNGLISDGNRARTQNYIGNE